MKTSHTCNMQLPSMLCLLKLTFYPKSWSKVSEQTSANHAEHDRHTILGMIVYFIAMRD